MSADPTIRLLLLGEDKSASKSLKDVGDEADKTGGRLSRMGEIAGGVLGAELFRAAATAIVSFGKDSIEAFRGAEAAQRQLEDAYQRFPAVASVNISAMRELNSAIQDKTGADADDLAASQASLAAYQLTGEQIKELTPLLDDYAVKTGKDLPSAAEDLGKAMLGQGRALKNVGIDFQDAGSLAGNFDQVMAGLRSQVGGFAEKEATSAEGRLRSLKTEFGDVQEAVGERLLPVLLDVGGVLLTVAKAANDNADALLPLGAGVAVLAVAYGALFGITKLVGIFSAVTGGMVAAQVAVERFGLQLVLLSKETGSTKLASLGAGIIGLGAALPVVAVAAAAGVAAWSMYAAQAAESKARVDELSEAIDRSGSVTNDTTREVVAAALEQAGALEAAQKLGIELRDMTDAGLGNADAMGRISDRLTEVRKTTVDVMTGESMLEQEIVKVTGSLAGQNGETEDAIAKSGRLADATEAGSDAAAGAADPVRTLAANTKDLATAAKEAADAVNAQVAAEWAAVDAALALSGSEIAFQKAIDDATAAVEANGQTLDLNTEAGRNNQAALDAIVNTTKAAVTASNEHGDSAEVLAGKVAAGREAFLQSATAMLGSEQAAQALWDTYALNPGMVETLIEQRGAEEAKQKAIDFQAALETIPPDTAARIQAIADMYGVDVALARLAEVQDKTVTIRTVYEYTVSGLSYNGGAAVFDESMVIPARATGGPVNGPGTSTSDSILTRVSNGEYVIRAASVDKIGGPALDYINATGELPPGYARGGQVGGVGSTSSGGSSPMSGGSTEIFQVVLDGRVVAEAVRKHDRGLR